MNQESKDKKDDRKMSNNSNNHLDSSAEDIIKAQDIESSGIEPDCTDNKSSSPNIPHRQSK